MYSSTSQRPHDAIAFEIMKTRERARDEGHLESQHLSSQYAMEHIPMHMVFRPSAVALTHLHPPGPQSFLLLVRHSLFLFRDLCYQRLFSSWKPTGFQGSIE